MSIPEKKKKEKYLVSILIVRENNSTKIIPDFHRNRDTDRDQLFSRFGFPMCPDTSRPV